MPRTRAQGFTVGLFIYIKYKSKDQTGQGIKKGSSFIIRLFRPKDNNKSKDKVPVER